MHQRALAIDEKAHGSDHPTVAERFKQLAELFRDQVRNCSLEEVGVCCLFVCGREAERETCSELVVGRILVCVHFCLIPGRRTRLFQNVCFVTLRGLAVRGATCCCSSLFSRRQ